MTRREGGRLLPDTAPARWPDPETGPFRLRLYWDLVEGRVECVGLELTSIRNPNMPMVPGEFYGRPGEIVQMEEPGWWSPPSWEPEPTTLTTSHLRGLNLSTLVGEVREALAESLWRQANYPALMDRSDTDPADYETLAEAATGGGPRRGRKPIYSTAHFRQVAQVYARSYVSGLNPLEAVMEWAKVTKSTAAKWVAKARDLGFLEPTEKGKAGGVPQMLRNEIDRELGTDKGDEE